jgi:hypothetical protein
MTMTAVHPAGINADKVDIPALTEQQRVALEDFLNGAANHGDRQTAELLGRALNGDAAATTEALALYAADPQADFG